MHRFKHELSLQTHKYTHINKNKHHSNTYIQIQLQMAKGSEMCIIQYQNHQQKNEL
uniref:Uncharacterized protein n=1 Tax=Rhizophora mucronata TaxID=61149 RepID=A0A2P2JFC2_RHIMU